MSTAQAYAAQSADKPLAPFGINRRDLRANDVQVDIILRRRYANDQCAQPARPSISKRCNGVL
jgi:hypothetical protein